MFKSALPVQNWGWAERDKINFKTGRDKLVEEFLPTGRKMYFLKRKWLRLRILISVFHWDSPFVCLLRWRFRRIYLPSCMDRNGKDLRASIWESKTIWILFSPRLHLHMRSATEYLSSIRKIVYWTFYLAECQFRQENFAN